MDNNNNLIPLNTILCNNDAIVAKLARCMVGTIIVLEPAAIRPKCSRYGDIEFTVSPGDRMGENRDFSTVSIYFHPDAAVEISIFCARSIRYMMERRSRACATYFTHMVGVHVGETCKKGTDSGRSQRGERCSCRWRALMPTTT